MESDGLGLDLALLHIDLVTAKNDGNVLANSDEITWNIVNHGFNDIMGGGRTHGASWERSCR